MQVEPHIATFVAIIASLRNALGICAHKGAFGPRASNLSPTIWNRITRLATRFTTLAARLQAGTLQPPRKRAPRPKAEIRPATPPETSPRPASLVARRLPRHFGYVANGGYEIRGYASQLDHLLARPEMIATIEADPRFGRALRPLCHLLGIRPPPALQLPRRPRAPRPQPRPTQPQHTPPPAQPPEPFGKPPGSRCLLPPGVTPARIRFDPPTRNRPRAPPECA